MTARRRAPHGARGLKSIVILRRHQLLRRAPHGARGLKSFCRLKYRFKAGRAPHGARGLKCPGLPRPLLVHSRAPHGARGLKFICHVGELRHQQSRPARGAWIEMARRIPCTTPHGVAPRTGRVD